MKREAWFVVRVFVLGIDPLSSGRFQIDYKDDDQNEDA
jgi:hypothetical protein